ncbi:FAD-binding oxidoreductase [Antribacter gilvus]|uniref:FAD-binding oxidoreductase n=1 Tax=Antribacter gilvus TaxID=2304675 RepID=UPI000F79FF1E|nr:FAD-binding oxidoreductase [Antribacter gilvus]
MTTLDTLRPQLAGAVHLPGDDTFDERRRPWNLAVDQPILAVAEPATATDVAALVQDARDSGRTLTLQASGHGASGGTEGTILVRTHHLDEIDVRPAERLVRVGAGARWGDVQAAVARHGLTGLPGSSPVVTVAGYTLGGGLSWFGRAHGWAADAVVALDVVGADGEARRVTADSDPDLFWALRGGGGDFAAVTSLELRLHPAPEVFGGRMLWPADRAPDVLAAFREVVATAPDELTVWFELLHFPGSDPMVAVDSVHLGGEDEARRLLEPLDAITGRFSDTRRPLRVDELGAITNEPTDPGAGCSRAELLTDLDDAVAQVLLAGPHDPLLAVQVRHLGGALARPSDSPHGALAEPFALYLFGVPFTPEVGEAVRARQAAIVAALGDRVSGRKPFTFLAPEESAAAAFGPEALARLRAIKAERDPHGVFRSSYPV